MSSEMNTAASEQLVMLDPSEIRIPDETNVRPDTSAHGDDSEADAIAELADTIREEGQIQPVKVLRGEDGTYTLIAGRRRTKAIEHLNLSRSNGEEVYRVKAVVSEQELSPAQMHRQAALENLQRKGLSPMDFAVDIEYVRKEYGWTGSKGTKKVAEYYKVSPAQITQHEKLRTLLPEELQARVHQGVMSRDAAFVVVRALDRAKTPGEREKVLAAAEELHQAMQKEAGSGSAGKSKVEAKAVRKAVREAGGQEKRTKKEILDWFAGMQGPVYGYASGAVHVFVRALLAYADGEIGDRALENKWSEMVKGADKGKPEPKVEVKASADAPGKKTKKTAKKK